MEVLNARFWLISFQDLMIEVIFESVSFLSREPVREAPHKTLRDFLRH